MVTQCPIPPGANYTYEYYLHQTGTFWLHGHTTHQNADGLRAPLVIYDRENNKRPMQYDDDYLITLEDWYAFEIAHQLNEIYTLGQPFPPPLAFPYGLINGYNGNDSHIINFTPGKRYRLRVINMGTTEWWKFRIPGHKLNVIEADGIYSEPLPVDGLDIGPGQRYSVVVQAFDSDEFNYNFNATLYASFTERTPGMNPRYYNGLVQYRDGAPVKHFDTISDDDVVWPSDLDLRAFDKVPALHPTRLINFSAVGRVYSDTFTYISLNKVPYTPPTIIPTLFTVMSTKELAHDESIYGQQTQAYVLQKDDVIELYMENLMIMVHSMHLHGHAFQVVETGPIHNDTNTASPSDIHRYNGWPMRRDTFAIHPGQYVKIRFVADNPGVWLFHCHMATHEGMGMVVTFIEAPDVLQKTQKIPDDLKQMCLRQGFKVSGNGAGKEGFDLSGLPPAPQ
ncbi:ferroxidase fet3, partial [Coemansia sp. RSA 2703]